MGDSGKVSAYSHALAKAIDQWFTRNRPLFEQFKQTPWGEIPEAAQSQIARRVRDAAKEEAVKEAIAGGYPVSSIACKPEFPNCLSVAGNMDAVGSAYMATIYDQAVKATDAAEAVDRGRFEDGGSQWTRIEQLDRQMSDCFRLLPRSAVLTELHYPDEPSEPAACHLARRRQERPTPLCTDPQTEAERRSASLGNAMNATSVNARDLGDLDGDGQNEFSVDISSFAVTSTTVVGRDAEGCTREVLPHASGLIRNVLESRTHRWKDLDFGVPVNRELGAVHTCWVTLRAKFDGVTYRMVEVIRVEQFLSSVGEADLVACRGWANELLDK